MNDCEQLLWQAFHSEYGIKVEVNDMRRARQQFYRARKTDEQLSCIAVVPSPFGDCSMYLVKKETKDG